MIGLLDDEYKIPNGTYYTPELANIKPKDATLVWSHKMAVTNATSKSPVIGTDAFNPCCCLIMYNPKNKTAALLHEPFPMEDHLNVMLSKLRPGENEIVELHLMGNPISTTDQEEESLARMHLEVFLKAVKKHPNIQIKTFDVLDKPKPCAVAFDTRNGRLIRGSNLHSTYEEASGYDTKFLRWPRVSEEFDGTSPKMQRQKQH